MIKLKHAFICDFVEIFRESPAFNRAGTFVSSSQSIAAEKFKV